MRNLLIAGFLLMANAATAQEMMLDLSQGTLAGRTLELFALMALLSLLPTLLITLTCFPFIITVLAILRQGIGLQQSPPNILLITLALFLTWFIMAPVLDASWTTGFQPILDGKMGYIEGITKGYEPFKTFMTSRVDPTSYELMASLRPQNSAATSLNEASVLIPTFIVSELSRAFQVGFLVYLPFLVIDMVVSAILMSMGMMMVPPAAVSLPFKLAFFVAADGWSLLATSLVTSY